LTRKLFLKAFQCLVTVKKASLIRYVFAGVKIFPVQNTANVETNALMLD